MATFKIRLLGQLEIVRGEEVLPRFPTLKSKGLFSFLALHNGKLHSRAILAGILWPGSTEASARKRLRTELWLTRKFLAPGALGESLLAVRNDSVGLDLRSGVWVDVRELESKLAPFEDRGGHPTAEDGRRLEEAAELYRGDLLEGSFDDWCLEARESLKTRFLAALERLLTIHQRSRRWASAIDCGRRILRHEPLIESVHRKLMRCFFEKGDRTAALRQYNKCVALLDAELDVEPMYETSLLARQIRAYRGPIRPETGAETGPIETHVTAAWS